MRQLVNNVQFSSIHEESRSEKKRKEKKNTRTKKGGKIRKMHNSLNSATMR